VVHLFGEVAFAVIVLVAYSVHTVQDFLFLMSDIKSGVRRSEEGVL
jgi:hypothetical protein